MDHQFRNKLRSGQLLVGTMITLESAVIAELAASVGFDWLFIDAEHSPMSASGLQSVLQGAGPKMPCLVRIEAPTEVPIKKALDIGAAGIIAPMVNSAAMAAQIVDWAKYSPMGSRGVGVGRAHGYGLGMQDYLQRANSETSLVIQAEHINAVNNIEEIVKVAGIDAVLIGPYDLSASLGRLGELQHPEVIAAIDHVTAVCREAQMPLGAFGISAAAAKPFIDRGYTLIVVGIDTSIFGQALQEMLAQVKT